MQPDRNNPPALVRDAGKHWTAVSVGRRAPSTGDPMASSPPTASSTSGSAKASYHRRRQDPAARWPACARPTGSASESRELGAELSALVAMPGLLGPGNRRLAVGCRTPRGVPRAASRRASSAPERHRDPVGVTRMLGMTPGRHCLLVAIGRRIPCSSPRRPAPRRRPRRRCGCWGAGMGHRASRRAFGHTWLELSPGDVAHVLLESAAALERPRPGLARRRAGAGASRLACTPPSRPSRWPVNGTAAVLRHLPGQAAGHRPGHARPAKHAGGLWAGARSGATAAHRQRRALAGSSWAAPPVSWAGCWRPRTATRYWSSAPPAAARPRPGHPRRARAGPGPWSLLA